MQLLSLPVIVTVLLLLLLLLTRTSSEQCIAPASVVTSCPPPSHDVRRTFSDDQKCQFELVLKLNNTVATNYNTV